jgi:hypothetical protein
MELLKKKADRLAKHDSISIIEAVNFHPRDRSLVLGNGAGNGSPRVFCPPLILY